MSDSLRPPPARPAARAGSAAARAAVWPLQPVRGGPRAAAARANGEQASARSHGGAGGQGEPGSTARIVEAITNAIVERRLMPGTKLAEQRLAGIFEVSRTIVRQALNQLSRDKLVTLEPGRGASVARPSVEEARQVFEVRRILEAALVARLAGALTPAQIAELRQHIARERAAVQREDVPGRTWLLADFHALLARMLGNHALAEILQDLVSRCSLISLMYQSAHSAGHSCEEHVTIVDALERGDGRAALRLMEAHLGNVERNLQLAPDLPDLEAVLRPR